jgi:hypothetical protein
MFCNLSVFALRLTQLGSLATSKNMRILGFHSSLTTSEHKVRVSTQSWLEHLISAPLKSTYAEKVLTDVTQGNRVGLMLSRPVEVAPRKATNSTQRVVSNYSAILTEVFCDLPQL